MTSLKLTRRQLLKAGGAVAGAALLGDPVLRALAEPRRTGRLDDIEHVVILIQENRSFDHYFGSYPAVRGFDDRHALPGVFRQQYLDAAKQSRVVVPFHLDTTAIGSMQTGECTNDITHGYDDQHTCWNNGAMNTWAQVHAHDNDHSFMGYYRRGDLPYCYALADAFTICDAYHCSVMGSTSSNRLYALTGTLDPEGRHGGPVLSTRKLTDAIPSSPTGHYGVFSREWVTYPEQLTDAGWWPARCSPSTPRPRPTTASISPAWWWQRSPLHRCGRRPHFLSPMTRTAASSTTSPHPRRIPARPASSSPGTTSPSGSASASPCWRRRTVGDLTSAFNFARPDASIPLLPNDPAQHPECLNAEVQSNPYVAPDPSATPPAHQEPGRRPSPSGPVHARGGHAD